MWYLIGQRFYVGYIKDKEIALKISSKQNHSRFRVLGLSTLRSQIIQ